MEHKQPAMSHTAEEPSVANKGPSEVLKTNIVMHKY